MWGERSRWMRMAAGMRARKGHEDMAIVVCDGHLGSPQLCLEMILNVPNFPQLGWEVS